MTHITLTKDNTPFIIFTAHIIAIKDMSTYTAIYTAYSEPFFARESYKEVKEMLGV